MGSFRKLKRERHEGDDNRVKEAAGNCSENNVVREEDSFQVDLRVHRVSQDSIYKDEERMTKIQTLVGKLQDGYRTKSISNTFSEASRLTIKEMGNIELYESCETFRTIPKKEQSTAYWNMSYASLEQTEKIKNEIDIFSNPLYIIKDGQSGDGPAQWQNDHWKATDATRGVKKRNL